MHFKNFRPLCFESGILVGRSVRAESRRETALERQQPLRVSPQPNTAREQRPEEISLTGQKSQPRFRIGSNLDVRFCNQAILDGYFSTANRNRCLGWLIAGENEVVSGFQLSSGVPLKRLGHSK